MPAGAKKVEEVEYTILNMFSINSIKQKGNLCVEDVEGLSSNNAWITGKAGVFYGMKKNMVEILPFNTTNIIDVDAGACRSAASILLIGKFFLMVKGKAGA